MEDVQDAIVVADETMMSMVEDARSTKQILALRAKVQRVREEVMVKDVHYGRLPGTSKDTLYQDGGDALGLTFHIAFNFDNVMEGDGIDEIAVRSKCIATYRGEVLGDCEGYASSNEEKYKWRRAVHTNEYDEADPDRRRLKWKNDGTSIKQVRTEPADIVNTVLKMAQKRAKLGVIKTVLAIGEMFGVDMDDVPPEIREAITEPATPAQPKRKSASKPAPAPAPAKVSKNPDPDQAADELENDEQSDDEGGFENTGKVTLIKELKRGKNAKGEWILTLIAVNDFEMTTFDQRLVSVAKSAESFDKTVAFDYELNSDPDKSPTLTALQEIKE